MRGKRGRRWRAAAALLLAPLVCACDALSGLACFGPTDVVVAEFTGFVKRDADSTSVTYRTAVARANYWDYAPVVAVVFRGEDSLGRVHVKLVGGSSNGGPIVTTFGFGFTLPSQLRPGDTLPVRTAASLSGVGWERWISSPPAEVGLRLVDAAIPRVLGVGGTVVVRRTRPAELALDLWSDPDPRVTYRIGGIVRFWTVVEPRQCGSD